MGACQLTRFLFVSVTLALMALSVTAGPPSPIDALPDFSYAGYHSGKKDFDFATPDSFDIRDYGAKPDDEADDTDAILAALEDAKAAGGIVRIPKGQWMLQRQLFIDQGPVAILGAGSDKTTIYIPVSLSDLWGWERGFSSSRGFFEVVPPQVKAEVLARAVGNHGIESKKLKVKWQEGVERPVQREWLQIQWFNDAQNDLIDYLYGGVVPQDDWGEGLVDVLEERVKEWVQVKKVSSNRLTFYQPLHMPTRSGWDVRVVRLPPIEEVAIQGLKIRFKEAPYAGHHKEKGYNAIFASGLVNGWIKDVIVENADSGVIVNRSRFVTVKNLKLIGRKMHHAISTAWSTDCLFDSWRVVAPHVHGTTISTGAHRDVYSRGFGNKLKMDAHRRLPFQNLHTQIEIFHGDEQQDVFVSGGSLDVGLHAGAYNIYWNIYHDFADGVSRKKKVFGPYGDWPLGVFAGWRGNRKIQVKKATGRYQVILFNNSVPVVPLWVMGNPFPVPQKIKNLFLYQRGLH